MPNCLSVRYATSYYCTIVHRQVHYPALLPQLWSVWEAELCAPLLVCQEVAPYCMSQEVDLRWNGIGDDAGEAPHAAPTLPPYCTM